MQAIYWPTILLTLKRFKATEHKTLQKFIHEWLPLQDQYHVQSTSIDNLCPLCHQACETAKHFLACPNLGWQQIWKELHDLLYQHQIKNAVSNNVGIWSLPWPDCPYPSQFQSPPPRSTCIVPSTRKVGLEAIVLWVSHTPVADATTAVPSTDKQHSLLCKGYHFDWQAVMKVWKMCNGHLHPGNQEQEDCSQLQTAVHQIFLRHNKTLNYRQWLRTSTWTRSWDNQQGRFVSGSSTAILTCGPTGKLPNSKLIYIPTIFVNTSPSTHQNYQEHQLTKTCCALHSRFTISVSLSFCTQWG